MQTLAYKNAILLFCLTIKKHILYLLITISDFQKQTIN